MQIAGLADDQRQFMTPYDAYPILGLQELGVEVAEESEDAIWGGQLIPVSNSLVGGR